MAKRQETVRDEATDHAGLLIHLPVRRMSTLFTLPFTEETARQQVRLAEDAWNTKDPDRVSLAYTPDTEWRNRNEFLCGRDEVRAFLVRKWQKELDYRLKKELWAFHENHIGVRFEYEWHDHNGQWFRSYGNEMWEFAPNGLMHKRFASINDLPIAESERRLRP